MTTEQQPQAERQETERQEIERQEAEQPLPDVPEPPAADAPEPVAAAGAGVPPTLPPTLPPSPPQAPAPKKDRRALRAALRWTAAVVVFASVGAGTAYGISRMERTDVPGLATGSDGRWNYPELRKPPLPAGSPGPLAEANKAGTHYADLRSLLLPAPEGATENRALRGRNGWLATKDFLAEYPGKEDRGTIGQTLTDYGLRHVAARGWTAPDGTSTRVYLLQFGTAVVADRVLGSELTDYRLPRFPVRGGGTYEHDEAFPEAAEAEDITFVPYTEARPYGAEQVRGAYVGAGDTLAVIVQSRRGTVPAVPFQQTVALQSRLLG
ncbi:hypothetical protein AB0F77_23200 [Streptomyces sp. NPDC026672]|uniref:hypothetical protein n=1 Tax=unclassified Streptomyces TaxID=2593676 RepID=UPI0033F57BA6